jgi:hypothetical protein
VFLWVLWLGAVSLVTTLTADEAFWISVVCMLMCGRQGAVYFDGAVASEAVLSFKHERVIMVEVCGRRGAVFSGEAVANEADGLVVHMKLLIVARPGLLGFRWAGGGGCMWQ